MTMACRQITGLDEGWNFMEKGITKVIDILEGVKEKSIDGDQYIYLYTTIYNLCTKRHPHNHSEELYRRYKDSFNDYINLSVLPALRQKHGEFMLRELVIRWKNHKVMVQWLSRFFEYLERHHIPRNSLPALREAGFMTFVDLVYNELKTNARNAVFALIEREREGQQIDRALLKNVLGIFVEIGMGDMRYYLNDFEAPMLEDTGGYYSRKAASWIIENSCPDYLLKAEECLQLEKDRVSHYLHASSEQNLLDKVQNELLAHYENQILEKEHSGVCALLRNDKQDDLSRMFKLFHKVTKGLDPIANSFKQHVIAEGSALVKQAEDAVTNNKWIRDASGNQEQGFVLKVIELHDKYTNYVSECFQNHNLFQKALKEAFVTFCNKGVAGSSTAELLSTFSDNVLKKSSSEKLSDDEIELALENVVKILAYLDDKDVFVEFYRKKLASRLLFDRSANDSNERSLLTKLKQECGSQFTAKMEGMVTDLSLARDNQNNFEAYLNTEDIHAGLDLNVIILTSGFWPTYKSADIILPIELVKCIDVFKQFYSTETKHRRLTWIYSLGTCIVDGRFDVKSIEMVVATYQAALLMLFNDTEKLSFADIKSNLNMKDEDVTRVLHSLACAKYKILLKKSNTQKIAPTDDFEFNSKFTDKSRRIKIALPQADEKKKVIDNVNMDRRYAIDASLVRIMKSRKVLSYQQLVSQCVEQLGQMFKPDFKAIKRRIEDLITREYLERDAENPNIFKYLA